MRTLLYRVIKKFWEEKQKGDWLTATISLVSKKGCETDPENYRLIALLSLEERVISQVIPMSIQKKAEEMIPDHAAGFVSGGACTHAVHALNARVGPRIKKKQGTACVFVDFKKAFDSLSWSTMWQILRRQGMPPFYVDMLQKNKMYEGAKMKIRLNKE